VNKIRLPSSPTILPLQTYLVKQAPKLNRTTLRLKNAMRLSMPLKLKMPTLRWKNQKTLPLKTLLHLPRRVLRSNVLPPIPLPILPPLHNLKTDLPLSLNALSETHSRIGVVVSKRLAI
jgi:hypothetical protein